MTSKVDKVKYIILHATFICILDDIALLNVKGLFTGEKVLMV